MKIANVVKLIFAVLVFTAVSCNPDEDDNNNAKGFVSFGLSANENTKSSEYVSAQIPI